MNNFRPIYLSTQLNILTMKHLFQLLILMFTFSVAFAQNVTNVSFHQKGNKVIIMYDLGKQADVSVYMSTDGGVTFGDALQHVTGAVGRNVPAGIGKRVEFDALAEYDKLPGKDVVFKVAASLTNATVNGVPFEMIYVEGGTFTMGATLEQGSDAYDNERPAHGVTVSDFYIGKYEVTQAQWMAVMDSNPSQFKGDNLPVECVSWDDVQEFIRKLNALTGRTYRLPTEAEWEYAARGGNKSKGYKYSGSNDIGTVTWYWENSGDKVLSGKWDYDKIKNNNCQTHPVGSKSPNELGLYDMSGNVYEWCSDWYGSSYYGTSSSSNPQGFPSGSRRVLRGGSYSIISSYCRVSFRNSRNSGYRRNYCGFRLVLVP